MEVGTALSDRRHTMFIQVYVYIYIYEATASMDYSVYKVFILSSKLGSLG